MKPLGYDRAGSAAEKPEKLVLGNIELTAQFVDGHASPQHLVDEFPGGGLELFG
jgi:hypothetical protein